MGLLAIVAASGILLLAAYRLYGRALSRWVRLDPEAVTPAVSLRDDLDYVPIESKFLISQHFSAIAAAGPVVGPILAGVMFGWVPALLWILLGSIFVGGVHDFMALIGSVRHQAKSLADVVREHMSRRSHVLFMIFIWIALVYVIVAFTDIVAGSFVGKQVLDDGTVVSGGGIASSSLLYLALPIVMGLLLRYTKVSLNVATLIFLPLVGVAIYVGQFIPFDLGAMLSMQPAQAQKVWDVLLLGYCLVAGMVPVWLLLQPRGHLGGFFLYIAIAAGCIGVLFGHQPLNYPAFTGWAFTAGDGAITPLMPMLFITVACGACSGFHSIVASGTTSKQIRCEPDAKSVGYGAMLLEAMVAVLALACVMILTPAMLKQIGTNPNLIYARGLAQFMHVFGVPVAFGISFGLLAFTTFVYDTLDVCTRLGRFIVQELTGWTGPAGRLFSTAATVGVPLFFVLQTSHDAAGKVIPAWKLYWPLFGASNQLLAALGLLGVTVWLWRTYRERWIWLVTGIPTVFMYIMSAWALMMFVTKGFVKDGAFALPVGTVPWAAVLLIGLAVLMLVEAVKAFTHPTPPAPAEKQLTN
ncbi:MAG: carbon starvation protein A [Armatimonadetes bacterium]|nr:carbon starvation protein A [Armatimonadota bacterium]